MDPSKRTRRSELLIGVFIGIYGNWLVALLAKLGNNTDFPLGLFLISFILLFFYFGEAYKDTKEQKRGMSIRLADVLSFVYFILILISLSISGLISSAFAFSISGLVIWILLWQVEKTYWR
jgi:hypothetical protein